MCPFPVGTAPLLTTNSTFVPPITGKGPPVRCLQSTNEAPQIFMPIDENSPSSSSSDLLSLLPECSHLTSFDSIPSTPRPTVSLGLDVAKRQALDPEFKNVQIDAVVRYICNVGFPNFQLDDEACEDIFIRSETTDKNITNENYTKGRAGHHPQSPSPSSGDTHLSCWETGPQSSYHGCNLRAFSPIPCQSQRGSTMIPDREHDAVVRQRFGQFCAQRIQNNCFAPRIYNKVLTPDPLDIPQVRMREVEDLEKVMVRDSWLFCVTNAAFESKSEGRVRDSIFVVANHGGLNFTHQRINVEQLPSNVSCERQPSFKNCVGDYQISLNPLSLLLVLPSLLRTLPDPHAEDTFHSFARFPDV
ncbi:hypothetical protein EV368DRAFT_68943 [Lentinula lateritia]|nr:hypothetical protein EV368DRAFT_68943 [Lentinula lateritia]